MAASRVQLPKTGDAWKALRERRGLSRAELARRLALDPSTLWKIEHDRSVSESTRRFVAAALGLDVLGLNDEGRATTRPLVTTSADPGGGDGTG